MLKLYLDRVDRAIQATTDDLKKKETAKNIDMKSSSEIRKKVGYVFIVKTVT